MVLALARPTLDFPGPNSLQSCSFEITHIHKRTKHLPQDRDQAWFAIHRNRLELSSRCSDSPNKPYSRSTSSPGIDWSQRWTGAIPHFDPVDADEDFEEDRSKKAKTSTDRPIDNIRKQYKRNAHCQDVWRRQRRVPALPAGTSLEIQRRAVQPLIISANKFSDTKEE